MCKQSSDRVYALKILLKRDSAHIRLREGSSLFQSLGGSQLFPVTTRTLLHKSGFRSDQRNFEGTRLVFGNLLFDDNVAVELAGLFVGLKPGAHIVEL